MLTTTHQSIDLSSTTTTAFTTDLMMKSQLSQSQQMQQVTTMNDVAQRGLENLSILTAQNSIQNKDALKVGYTSYRY